MGIGDKISNKAEELAGKAKEAAGDATDNERLQAEGQSDQASAQTKQAGEHAAKAGVDRLLVTHVPPWNSREVQAEQAATAFKGAIEIATAGAEIWV